MPEHNDPFLAAALRLGFLREGEARKAEKEAARTGRSPRAWLLERGILTPREIERISRTTGLTRRTTRRGAAVAPRGGSGGLLFAMVGFVVVLGGGVFFFKDRIFGTSPSAPQPVPPGPIAEAPAGGPEDAAAVPAPAEPEPAPAVPIPEAPPETKPKTPPETKPEPGPEKTPTPAPEKAPGATPEAATPDQPEAAPPPATPPRQVHRDPALLKAGDAAFERGEGFNKQVGEAEGAERTDLMVKALEAYTEALAHYREYCGSRVPAFLDQRYAEVNGRIAILRKLLPPEKAAQFINRLTERGVSAAELLARAEASYAESPRNFTYNYMLFQRVLDEHPEAPEAVRALRRVGEIGWLEIQAVTSRLDFSRRVDQWRAAMLAGDYERVRHGLAEVQADPELRTAMQQREWEWYQTAERALRVPAAALEGFLKGRHVKLRRRGGASVEGRIESVLAGAIRFEGGRLVKVGELDPVEIVQLAYGSQCTASQSLSAACFLAFSGECGKAVEALEVARKRGVPVTDYETPIRRMEYESTPAKK